MDLKQLKAVGGLITTDNLTKVKKTWTNPDGEDIELEFYVRRQTFYDVENLYISGNQAAQAKDQKDRRSTSAQLISQCLRLGKNGEQVMEYADACLLEPSLAMLFVNAIHEVQVQKKTHRQKRKSSGTSSSLQALAEEPLKKPSSDSVTESSSTGSDSGSVGEA